MLTLTLPTSWLIEVNTIAREKSDYFTGSGLSCGFGAHGNR
jgi:hypothetical protein